MEFNKEQFEQFYEWEFIREELKITNKSNGKAKYIFLGQDNVFSFTKEPPTTMEQAEKLIEDGIAIKVPTEELYIKLLNFDEEQLSKRKFGFGLITDKFLKNELEKINFVKMECNYDGISKEHFIKKVDDLHYSPTSIINFANLTRELELFKLASDEYVLQFYEVYPPDDFAYIKYYFSKEPTIAEFNRYEFICKIEDFFKKYGSVENIEMINDKHWTEFEGSLEDKFKELKHKALIFECSLDC